APAARARKPHPGAAGAGGRRRDPPLARRGRAHLGADARRTRRSVPGSRGPAGVAVTEAPRFVVVGRVNKGKSSIVATLAEDDSVRIDPRPGTTTEVREYPVRVDGRTLFTLVDTPGFEDAPRALAWLRQREVSAANRPSRVEELLSAHEGTGEF